MTILLIKSMVPSDFEFPELRQRSQESSKSENTIHYRVTKDGQEVAFISLDRWPTPNYMVLYEIYVAKKMRRQGIGTAVLAEVENAAIKEGISKMLVCPRPLDQEISQQGLVEWYAHLGYHLDANTNDMEKDLPKTKV